jgi:hypothetical protein
MRMMNESRSYLAARHGGGRRATLLLPLALAVWMVAATILGTAATPVRGDQDDGEDQPSVVREEVSDAGEGGGPHNIVRARNHVDDRLLVRGRIQLNRIRGQVVEPVNSADAFSSCVDCSTVAVALQMNFYRERARTFTPQNIAVALNERCMRCATAAIALQYSFPVDDPEEAVDDDVEELVRAMERELRSIQREDRRMTLGEATARIDSVVASFQRLAMNLSEARDERSDDDEAVERGTTTATPTVELTSTVELTLTPTPAAPTPTPSQTVSDPPPSVILPGATSTPMPVY